MWSAYLPLFTFKERNSSLFWPIFLKFTFNNFTSPVGLAILKFYLPGPNFTSLGHRACTIFRRLQHQLPYCKHGNFLFFTILPFLYKDFPRLKIKPMALLRNLEWYCENYLHHSMRNIGSTFSKKFPPPPGNFTVLSLQVHTFEEGWQVQTLQAKRFSSLPGSSELFASSASISPSLSSLKLTYRPQN